MATTADLEILLTRLDVDSYHVHMEYRSPFGEPCPPQRSRLNLDYDRLQALFPDPESYGSALTRALFGDPDNRDYLAEARRLAAEASLPLRLWITVDPARTRLIGLRWETLRDPQDGSWLLGKGDVQLVRRIHSPDWPPRRPLERPTGRALAVIGCPLDLHGHAPWTMGQSVEMVNARLEASLATLALAGYEIHLMVGQPVGEQPVTVPRLRSALCDEVDLLYLVCPSALRMHSDNPGLYLFLEEEDGSPQALAASEMLDVLHGCRIPPLVVLAAPQTLEADGNWAQSDPLGALRRLVSGLLEMGAGGVLAFNGAAGQAMLSEFIPRLLEALRLRGQVGEALAAARHAVRYHPDAWTPALFLREANDQLWLGEKESVEDVLPPPATTWMISASPERFNWGQAFAARTILWDRSFGERARQVMANIRSGDMVLLYSSDPENSLLGMARVQTDPRLVTDWEGERLAIRLELHTRWQIPVPRARLAEAAPSLELLRSPFASFTRVTPEEWQAIARLIP